MPYRLTLIRLYCEDLEDALSDQPYIKLNDTHYWGPVEIERGKSTPIAANPYTMRGPEVDISLYEQDDLGPDDYLGTVTASTDQAGQGEQPGQFSQDEASYRLTYKVDYFEGQGNSSQGCPSTLIVALLVTAPTMVTVTRYLLRRFGTR